MAGELFDPDRIPDDLVSIVMSMNQMQSTAFLFIFVFISHFLVLFY